MATWVRARVDELPPELRDAIVSVDLGGESQRAYAERVGLAYSTAKSRVQRGRSRLRALTEACCRLTLDGYGGLVAVEPRCCR